MEREILKKATAFFAKENSMRFAFIEAEKANCQGGVFVQDVGSVQKWILCLAEAQASASELARMHGSDQESCAIHRASRRDLRESSYLWELQARRLSGQPQANSAIDARDGNNRRVIPRRFRKTTDSNHHLPVAQNVLARNFEVDGPNQVWVTDITLCVDLGRLALPGRDPRPVFAARRWAGRWPTITRAELVLEALHMALGGSGSRRVI